MNLKKLVKWVLISLLILCSYLLGKYQAELLIYISIGVFPLGIYLIYNPTLITQSSMNEMNEFDESLLEAFKGYHDKIELKAKQLKEQYKLGFYGSNILYCLYIFLMLYALIASIHEDNKLPFLFLFSLMLIFFVILESDELIEAPFSRKQRVKSNYFLSMLNNQVALKELIKASKMKSSKNDFIKYVLDKEKFDNLFELLVNHNLLVKTPTSKYSFNLIEGTESQNLSSLLAVLIHGGIIKADITRGQNKKSLDTFFELETTAEKNSKDYLCFLEPRDFIEYLQLVKDPSKKSHAGLNLFITPYQNLLDSINKP